MDDIYEFVVSALASKCKVDPHYINSSMDLFADLGIDSTDFLDIAYSIEEKYGVRLPAGDWMSEVNTGDADPAEHFRIDNLVAAIEALVQREPAS
jgi:acyl carrier protein